MKIRKYLPFICSIIILVMSVYLPYFLLMMQDYLLLNKNEIHYIEDSGYVSQQLSTLQKIKFLSYYPQINMSESSLKNQKFSFIKELESTEIDLIYKEVEKLHQYNGFVQISKEDIGNYYRCTIKTYQRDQMMVTIAQISFSCQNVSIDIWFDNDTYQIYQYNMFAKKQDKEFKSLDVYRAFCQYLNIEMKDFEHFYSVYHDGYTIEVMLNHVDVSVDEN